jgi:hypothetical protein
MAAVLACGPGAAVSHRTAADLWGLRQTAAARIDVTVPTRAGRKPRSRIRIHRARLASADVPTVEGIPATTVPRTLIDLPEEVPERGVERALDEAEFLRLFDKRAIEAAIERNGGASWGDHPWQAPHHPSRRFDEDGERPRGALPVAVPRGWAATA